MPRKTKEVEKIEEIIGDLFGEEIIPIVFKLREGENISEFDIAEELGTDIHQIRAILYKLYEYGLATFYRKKDKIKGWYVCYWNFEPSKVDHLHSKLKRDRLNKLQERLQKEENNDFYMCKNLCLRTTFDEASELNYRCPECNELMNPVDNKRTIEFLQERIVNLTKEMSA